MSPELIGIMTVGAALAALTLTGFGLILTFVRRLEVRLDARLDAVDVRLQAVERGQARLEGLLEGLREALFNRPPVEPARQ